MPANNTQFKIKNRRVGKGNPAFIIAELSANHNHDYGLAVETIREIKRCGADAVKLQTYTPDTITIDCDNDYFRIKQGTIWDGKTLYQLYKEASTPWEWLPKLIKIAEDLGLICFSSVADKTAVDFMEELNTPIFKLPSFEITDLPLIEYISGKGKPVIFSTGIATSEEIRDSVRACRKRANNQIAILKCTSAYPTPFDEVNLNVIPDLKNRFKVVVGLSDHTLGISASLAAVALGAKIIERHFILDRKLGGPDAAFSLEPQEFKEMVRSIREVERALGTASYELTKTTKKSREFARSLFVVRDIKAGDKLTEENLRSIRPGYGLAPKYYKCVLGRKVKLSVKRGFPLKWEMLSKSSSRGAGKGKE